MLRVFIIFLCLSLFSSLAMGQVKGKVSSQAKELSGMSIVGNYEAPKSLYIVPWKSSELGVKTSLNMMLSEDDSPVDREVFMRQLAFYEASRGKSAGDSAPK